MEQRAYDLKSFCERYGIGRTRAYAEIGSGRLKAVKFGSKTLIRAVDAEAWLSSLPALELQREAA
jgi:hypothetical protein